MNRIAVIATIYRYLSHAQHFADRFSRWLSDRGEMASPRYENCVSIRRPEARG